MVAVRFNQSLMSSLGLTLLRLMIACASGEMLRTQGITLLPKDRANILNVTAVKLAFIVDFRICAQYHALFCAANSLELEGVALQIGAVGGMRLQRADEGQRDRGALQRGTPHAHIITIFY